MLHVTEPLRVAEIRVWMQAVARIVSTEVTSGAVPRASTCAGTGKKDELYAGGSLSFIETGTAVALMYEAVSHGSSKVP